MLTAAECRDLARSYRSQSKDRAVSPKQANVLRNIANSLSGLAKQLEMLADDDQGLGREARPSEFGRCVLLARVGVAKEEAF